MALPKQVQAQLAEVEAYEKALEAQSNPQDGELDTETEVVAETKEAPKLEKAKPADTPPTDVEEETFKQKYKTLTGKYDAEVPRLHQQVREMTAATKQLREELKALKVEPTKSKEKVSLVTDADRAEFGEDLLDVQRRVAREVSEEYSDRLGQQDAVIQKLQDDLAKTGNQVGEVNFSQRLAQLVPDFAQIDNDDRWVSWLNEHDPMLRGPRRVQAQQAFDAGDVDAIAHYVGLWKETLAAPTAAKPNQAELEKQVAPNRSANSARAQSTTQNSKIYSQKDADRVWSKVRTLNTRGQYVEAEKLEADLTVAYMEGRVRV